MFLLKAFFESFLQDTGISFHIFVKFRFYKTNSLELGVWNFVCKSHCTGQRIEYYRNDSQKYEKREIESQKL